MPDETAIPWLSVRELGVAYRDGGLTPVQVVQIALAQLAALEPTLNAFIEPGAASARAAAELATRDIACGLDRGPLHGIPVAIKDLIDVAGLPTTYATRAVPPVMPARDAELVRRLREAGAIILGKTNLLEFAYGSVHPAFGQTNNPHDPARTSGGSSGGSAAAVAAGIVPLAVGTDTGGSIRIPAAYCGIVGLKPSYGLVPTDGVFPLSWSLDHAGPLARTVADAAIFMAAVTGQPRADDVPPGRLRFGVVRALLDAPVVTPGVRACIEAALETLRGAGAAIHEVTIPELDAANAALTTILLPEARLVHEAMAARDPGGYAAPTLAQIEAGRHVPATDLVRARHLAQRLRAAIEALFDRCDALLTPTVAWIAPGADPDLSSDDGDVEMLSSGFTNLTGHPSLSLPCGASDGLPVGLQLVGALGADARLLAVAAAVEAAMPAARRPGFGQPRKSLQRSFD